MGKNMKKSPACFLVTLCVESKTTGGRNVTFPGILSASAKHCRPYVTFNSLKTTTTVRRLWWKNVAYLNILDFMLFVILWLSSAFKFSAFLSKSLNFIDTPKRSGIKR